MDRRIVWIFVAVGSTLGALVPEAWGGSSLGVMSFALGLIGALGGLWLGIRVTD